MSGAAGDRLSSVTIKARSFPLLMKVTVDGSVENDASTCPPIRASTAGPPPLYWMYVKSTFVRFLNISPLTCDMPVPVVPKLILPGRARRNCTNCGSVFTGTEGCTTSTLGNAIIMLIGAKSSCVLYGIFSYGFITSSLLVPCSSV